MKDTTMLTYSLLFVITIPLVLTSADSSSMPSSNGLNSTALIPVDSLQRLESGKIVSLAEVPNIVSTVLNLTVHIVDQISGIVATNVDPVTGKLGTPLKLLLTPIIFPVRLLLLGIEILLWFLLTALSTFLLNPLLDSLGLGSLIGAVAQLEILIYTVLDGLICILSQLSYIQIFNRCDELKTRPPQ